MNVVQKVENFVEDECKKPGSKYGYEPFIYHFKQTVEYAGKLSDEFGGDREVILIAAWLHDIGSIVEGRKNHHVSGAKIAETKLKIFGYPTPRIALVKKCIHNHRGSKSYERLSIEEKIVAEADIMSVFDNISGIFKAAFVYENLDQGEAIKSVRKKLINKWKRLHFQSSKKMLKSKYEAAMILLK